MTENPNDELARTGAKLERKPLVTLRPRGKCWRPKGTHIEVLNGRLDSLKLESEVGGLEDVRSDIRVRRQ